ncbi:carboxymuconolactone decarboxylase family protein [Sphingobium sp. DC-2]|uniref:carboxymuconolactone decarboxylase family protein n=1 Tax=Sphingobium sp. DC-2 TaxID=1303256 RepID=UPI0004AB751D|nr:carboxymuconolactone decarboxylase family protein [Sphingobium sp. DC-2]
MTIQSVVAKHAPKLTELGQDLLFGEIWERPELSKRDRSLITVAALIALRHDEPLAAHFKMAVANGVSRAELSEVITHLAFYAGWPSAVAAARQADLAFADD